MGYNIAIDGPAGAGKSTIAKAVAEKLGFVYVDTGAMYRALALLVIRDGQTEILEQSVSKLIESAEVTIDYIDNQQQIILNGENVTAFIRAEAVGKMASTISAYADVRAKLLALQRELADKANVIMDGRDIGSFVLPNAQIKIYLTASARERAVRRCNELTQKGIACRLVDVERDIIERDLRDMNREIAPLVQAKDAVYIDSSQLSIDEVIIKIIEIYQERS